MAHIAALIPIRLDSTRLPNKALQDVAGVPAVQRLITQVLACGLVRLDSVFVCTTERPQDDPLVEAVSRTGARTFRGSTDDLIDRLLRATRHSNADVVLQVDGDDICAEPAYMASCVEQVLSGAAEVVYCGDGLPLGLGSKAFRADCLERIFQAYVPGKNDTGFGYYLTKSNLFKVQALPARSPDHVMPDLRLTLDYPEDLALFREVYRLLRGPVDAAVTVDEICALLRREPQLKSINTGLDEGYWQRTRELMELHPLRLRVADKIVDVTPK